MGDPKETAKAAKKAAKAQAKIEKKSRAQTDGNVAPEAASVSAVPPESTPGGLAPAERAAAAAERQVKLQTYRVWITIFAALIALAGVFATIKSWQAIHPEVPPEETPSLTTEDKAS